MPHTPARRRRAITLFLSLLGLSTYVVAAVGAAVVVPAPAQAHAGLVSSTPEEGEVLTGLPDEVTLTFSEPVAEPAFVAVRTADGTTYEDGAATIDGAVVTQPLVAADAPGTYTVAYRVVSEDGHVVTGEFDVAVEGDAGATTDNQADQSQAAGEVATDHGTDGHDDVEESGSDATLVAGGVVLALLVVGAVVLALARRRRR
ncbi:MAG: copper resistance protein CopC [Streptomyces albidoflavus]